MPHARNLDDPRLIDHLPELLERIVQSTEAPTEPRTARGRTRASERHAISRVDEGFDVVEVVRELAMLRDVVLDSLGDPGVGEIDLDQIRTLDRAIDDAIADTVARYVEVREHALIAAADEREHELHALADNIPQLVWMADGSGSAYWFNRRWYKLTGATADAIRDRGWEAFHHPDHVERVKAGWQRAVATGEPWEDVYPVRRFDGRYRWFLGRAVPIRDATGAIERWLGTSTDVTERRFLDDATRVLTSSLDYRGTLEQLSALAVPDLADWCIVDLVDDGTLEHVAIAHSDPAKLELAREYARADQPSVEREPGTAEVLRTGAPRVIAAIDDAMLAATARSPDHLRLLRELGFRSWIGAPLLARGETIGVIHLVMSDSGRHYTAADAEVAAELGRRAGAAVENARLYRRAQEAVRTREDVLAIVSHDVRSPLGAIDLAATVLLEQFGSEPRPRKYLETIQRASTRIERLISDLLDMASINVGRFAVELAPLDAGEVLDEVLDGHEPAATARGIMLVRNLDARGVPLRADRHRLIQALGNLLGNALKFGRRGDTVTVSADRNGDRLRIRVVDSGPGIPAAELPRIFEPYWSGRHGTTQGTGLGLYITRAIVLAHGGTIDVHSVEGQGAAFELALPIAVAAGGEGTR